RGEAREGGTREVRGKRATSGSARKTFERQWRSILEDSIARTSGREEKKKTECRLRRRRCAERRPWKERRWRKVSKEEVAVKRPVQKKKKKVRLRGSKDDQALLAEMPPRRP